MSVEAAGTLGSAHGHEAVERACPACGVRAGELLVALEARDFARLNWTYVPDYAQRLGIEERAPFPVDRCRACGFIYARNLPSGSFLRKVYDDVIDTRLAAASSATPLDAARRMRNVARLAALALPAARPGEAIARHCALDFGSGFGRTSRLLAELGCDVTAFDPSPARRQAGGERQALVRVVSTLEEIVARGPYRIVVVDNVLEHLPDPRQTLDALSAACQPGAVVFVSVPSYEPEKVARLVREHRAGRLADMTLNPWEHLNYFDLRQLDRMMAQAGLVPLLTSELPAPVDIGLRPEPRRMRRIANAVSSALRLARYATTGEVLETVEERYYRRLPTDES